MYSWSISSILRQTGSFSGSDDNTSPAFHLMLVAPVATFSRCCSTSCFGKKLATGLLCLGCFASMSLTYKLSNLPPCFNIHGHTLSLSDFGHNPFPNSMAIFRAVPQQILGSFSSSRPQKLVFQLVFYISRPNLRWSLYESWQLCR